MDSPPLPTSVKLHRKRRVLALDYANGERHELDCEYLRVYSPSAEVRGHGPGQEVLQHGKRYVNVERLEPVGHYALQLTFDDGHDTGIFSWQYLYELATTRDAKWENYLARLAAAGLARDPDVQVLKL